MNLKLVSNHKSKEEKEGGVAQTCFTESRMWTPHLDRKGVRDALLVFRQLLIWGFFFLGCRGVLSRILFILVGLRCTLSTLVFSVTSARYYAFTREPPPYVDHRALSCVISVREPCVENLLALSLCLPSSLFWGRGRLIFIFVLNSYV